MSDMYSEFFAPDAKTYVTRRNIYNKLKDHISKKYNVQNSSTVTNTILKEHGLDSRRFDFVANIENFFNNRINDISVDSNSNKGEVHPEAIMQESIAPIKKLIGYDMLYRMMKSMYGKEEADRLSMLMYDYTLYFHDSCNTLKIYCWALSTNFIVHDGRSFGSTPSAPAHRLDSYMGAVCETLHQLSNHTAGAIALSTLFLDTALIMMCIKGIDGEPVSLEELKNNKMLRYKVKNEFQSFIHSCNSLSRNSVESPFSNVTLSDEIKLRNIAKDYQWQFVKPGTEDTYSVDEIVDYITEMQKLYVEVFDVGNSVQGGMQFRFPVTTVALSLDEDKKLIESEWFKWFYDHADATRYNQFISDGDKTCSCCRLLNDGDLLKQGSSVSSLGNVTVSMGSIRVVTQDFNRPALESTSIDDFFDRFKSNIEASAKILRAHRELIISLEKAGLQPFITNGIFDLSRLFSTFGVAGIVECCSTLVKKFGCDKDEIMDRILDVFNEEISVCGKKYGFPQNAEFIPGESACVKFASVDALLFGKENQPSLLYSNQFIPLWDDSDIFDRLSIAGKYDRKFSGGGISHGQVSDKISPEQARKLVRYAANKGCQHFALNCVMSLCKNNHYTYGKHTQCPDCGADIVDYYTRVVGFFIPVSNMNKVRRDWEFPNRKFVSVDEKN